MFSEQFLTRCSTREIYNTHLRTQRRATGSRRREWATGSHPRTRMHTCSCRRDSSPTDATAPHTWPLKGVHVSHRALNTRTEPKRAQRAASEHGAARGRMRTALARTCARPQPTNCTEAPWTPVNEPVVQAGHGVTSAMHTEVTHLNAFTRAAPLYGAYMHASCRHCTAAGGSERMHGAKR